jgi:hypothetical protein
MAILERLSDPNGCAILGWVAPRVLYARFERSISADVGVRFASRFSSLMGDVSGVQYFGDSSGVTAYDLAALKVVMGALLAKREQLDLIVVRPWNGVLNSNARSLPDEFGYLEYVSTSSEFEARLRAAAPTADLRQFTTLVDTVVSPIADTVVTTVASPVEPASGDAETHLPPSSSNVALDVVTYSYVFDLADFERGAFTATRYAYLSAHPRAAWVCVARNDTHALALAIEAARSEWAAPLTRPREQFTVRFVHAPVIASPKDHPLR